MLATPIAMQAFYDYGSGARGRIGPADARARPLPSGAAAEARRG
jgi:hypothetical protein